MEKEKLKFTNKSFIKRKKVSVFVLIILIPAIILLSEALYIYKNKPENIAWVFLLLATKGAERENFDKVIKNLDSAASFYIKQNQISYKDKIPSYENNNELSSLDIKTKKEALDYLKINLPLSNDKKSIRLISNIYYNLGIIAYNRNFHREANSLFRTSVFLDPDLSFLHIELANSYLNDGEYEKGVSALSYCLKFEPPRKHCQEYLDFNVNENSYEAVGIFKDTIYEHQCWI